MSAGPGFEYRQPVRVTIDGIVDSEYEDGEGNWRVVVEFQADRRRLIDIPFGAAAARIEAVTA